mmetsp:Transcript_4808/g.14304  ORF Transcript_4808/g.14304 Transcript_4808/m.14304 type:complete len:556 (-) Transcript_4808:1289-2956(-)
MLADIELPEDLALPDIELRSDHGVLHAFVIPLQHREEASPAHAASQTDVLEEHLPLLRRERDALQALEVLEEGLLRDPGLAARNLCEKLLGREAAGVHGTAEGDARPIQPGGRQRADGALDLAHEGHGLPLRCFQLLPQRRDCLAASNPKRPRLKRCQAAAGTGGARRQAVGSRLRRGAHGEGPRDGTEVLIGGGSERCCSCAKLLQGLLDLLQVFCPLLNGDGCGRLLFLLVPLFLQLLLLPRVFPPGLVHALPEPVQLCLQHRDLGPHLGDLGLCLNQWALNAVLELSALGLDKLECLDGCSLCACEGSLEVCKEGLARVHGLQVLGALVALESDPALRSALQHNDLHSRDTGAAVSLGLRADLHGFTHQELAECAACRKLRDRDLVRPSDGNLLHADAPLTEEAQKVGTAQRPIPIDVCPLKDHSALLGGEGFGQLAQEVGELGPRGLARSRTGAEALEEGLPGNPSRSGMRPEGICCPRSQGHHREAPTAVGEQRLGRLVCLLKVGFQSANHLCRLLLHLPGHNPVLVVACSGLGLGKLLLDGVQPAHELR